MYKKFLLYLILSLLLCFPALSKTLQGGVMYTVETAREIAFEGVKKQIDKSELQEHLKDKNYEENQKAISKGKNKLKDRYITTYSDGGYSIRYKVDISKAYYYSSDGTLELFDITDLNGYPRRALRYCIDGKLDNVSLAVSKNDGYIFDLNKKLIAHWIGKNGYDENGELFGTRDY